LFVTFLPRSTGRCCSQYALLQAEREARYHEYVSRLPFNSIEIVDEAVLARIMRRTRSKYAKQHSEAVRGGKSAHTIAFIRGLSDENPLGLSRCLDQFANAHQMGNTHPNL
jgi:hypothetical protein